VVKQKKAFLQLLVLSFHNLTIVLWVLQVRDMPDGSARWIAKPSITNQATGICIFDRVSQLEAALHANEDLREWVLQRWELPEDICDSAKFALIWPHLVLFGLIWSHVAYPDLICQLPLKQKHNSLKL